MARSDLVTKQVKLLLRALPSLDRLRRVIVQGSEGFRIAEAIAKRHPNSCIHLIIDNAKDQEEATRVAKTGNIRVAVATDLSPVSGMADLVVLRASGFEGKQVLMNRIRDAGAHLAGGGWLFLLTHTRQGAPSQKAFMDAVFSNVAVAGRGGGGVRVLQSQHRAEGSIPKPEHHEFEETIRGHSFRFRTTAAVFSKDRLDRGTRFLLECLPSPLGNAILDLGCGYGAIGIVLARLDKRARVTLVDRDLAVVELARTNAELNGVRERTNVVLSDGLKELKGAGFDCVVTHFPLHVPRHELRGLLREAHASLQAGQPLYGVALEAYDIRPDVEAIFGNVELLAHGPPSAEVRYRVVYTVKQASGL